MKDYFTYNPGKFPEGDFRISPSQLSMFFDHTAEWYRTHLLGEAPLFTGSTASELGTCVHAAAAMYFDNKIVDKQSILDYINTLPETIDKPLIISQLKPMVEVLINNFLAKVHATHSEIFIHTELLPNIHVGGSVDLFDERTGTVYDYKTIGSLDSARIPTSFPRAYWFQQMTYAYILRKLGYTVNYCKLVYITRSNINRISETTGKPLKDYPSELHILTEPVNESNMAVIEGQLNLIAHSVNHWKQHPEHHYLLAQDFRLYQPPKPANPFLKA